MNPSIRRVAFNLAAAAATLTMFGAPLVLLSLPALLWPARATFVVTLLLAPVVYSILFVTVAGLISRPFQSAIVAGRFPRDLSHPVYARRRLYGLCWTLVYYFKPVYAMCLAIPVLKVLVFRLFGYRGQMDFTVYPDTWIRDLPLLDIGKGAYISNRATLGTNMCLTDGTILVDGIRLGKGAMVGHLTMLAPGVVLGDGAEVAVGCAIGIRCDLGADSLVQPTCTVNHYARIGEKAIIGTMSYVGAAARIAPGVMVAPASLLRGRARISAKDGSLDRVISSETDVRKLELRSETAA